MPTTKKTSNRKTNNTKATSKKAGRLGTLLGNRFLVFALVFVAVGAFVTYKYSMAATPPPVGDVKGVGALVWSDEFNGSSLNLTKWQPNWHGGSDTAVTEPINTGEESCYDPKQVSVSNGTVKLTAEAKTFSGCNTRNGRASYVSGIIMSKKEDFRYGYYEARVFIPGDGRYGYNFPAFWTNGQHSRGWAQDGEIDIFEILGGGSKGELDWHYHYGIEPNNRNISTTDPQMTRHDGWHTFGLKREAGKQTFYYDGKEVGSNSSNLTSSPHYVIFNNGISSEHGGTKKVPATMEVDYFRFWELGSGSGDGGTGDTGGGTVNAPPTVSLASLNSTYTAPANVTLSATASDADGIAKVEFYRGSTKLGEDTTAPYSFAWNNIPAGTYNVTARAIDKKGLSTTSSDRTFTVSQPGAPVPEPDTPSQSNGSPVVSFGTLSQTYTAPATVNVTVSATDSDGVNRVSFYDQNDQWLGTDSTAPYTATMRELGEGTYSVYVRATDERGNTTTSPKKSFKVAKGTSTGGTGESDKQAPSVPTGLSRSLNIEWMRYILRLNWKESSDNIAVKDYIVDISSVKGNERFVTTSLGYGYANMQQGVKYNISVRARDAAGNISGAATSTATAQCTWIFCSLQ